MKEKYLSLLQSIFEIETKKIQGEIAEEKHNIEKKHRKQKQNYVLFQKTKWTLEDPLDRSFISLFYNKHKYDSYLLSQETASYQKKMTILERQLKEAIIDEETINILRNKSIKHKTPDY